MSVPMNRLQATFDMFILDHGFFRVPWRNLHEIAPGVWRSNQPSPSQIRDLERRGMRTIINVRGTSTMGSHALERDTCEKLGLTLVNSRLYSREAPRVEEVERLFAAFEAAEKPMLIHCKSGADRAGLASALYMLWSGQPPEEAMRQLSWRYLHVRHAKTGVLDLFIETYVAAHRETGIGFRDWLHYEYDKKALTAAHRSSGAGNVLVDRILNRE